MNILNYKETLQDLHSIPRVKKENNLHRMNRLMTLLGNPEDSLKCVHVAGTNGKGSISKMIAHGLSTSGYEVGLFTSPYILEFRERISLNDVTISEEEVIQYYEAVKKAIERLLEEGHSHPSEFEVVTAMAFLYFKDKKTDYCVIEVGIGGRYDATNVLTPVLSVLTSISRDHMSQLGETLEEIASHKAGIIKKAPVISSPQKEEVEKVLRETAKDMKTSISFIEPSMYRFIALEGFRQKIRLQFPKREPLYMNLNLLGTYQLENAATAVLALLTLLETGSGKITLAHITASLATVTWMGRMEILSAHPLTIVDGAHNEDGAKRIIESMKFYFPERRILLLLGMLKDKEVTVVTKLLAEAADEVFLHTPDDFRALDEEALLSMLPPTAPAVLCHSITEAYEKAASAYNEGDIILSAGSLYTIKEMKDAVACSRKA